MKQANLLPPCSRPAMRSESPLTSLAVRGAHGVRVSPVMSRPRKLRPLLGLFTFVVPLI